MPDGGEQYPVGLEVDCPERQGRALVFFRLLLVIPIAFIFFLLVGQGWSDESDSSRLQLVGAGFVILPTLLMLLFRHRYPRWWFDWNRNLLAFGLRVSAYLQLLRDEYPATEEEQAVRLKLDYPDAGRELNRWLPLVKWLLALPHVVVLAVLEAVAGFCVLIAWWAILFTGRYPKALHGFVVGVMRWSVRVFCYAVLMTTDRYPPFSLAD